MLGFVQLVFDGLFELASLLLQVVFLLALLQQEKVGHLSLSLVDLAFYQDQFRINAVETSPFLRRING